MLLLDELGPRLTHQPKPCGKALISPEKQLLIFIWYLSNKDSMRVVARLLGVSKSTTHKYIIRVSRALSDLSAKLITWPTHDEQHTISNSIEQQSNIQNCVGFIDGSHIRLQSAPGGDTDYINRKKYNSVQLQIVVDDKMIITDMYVGWPGCTHDARVFRNSPISFAMQHDRNCLAPGKFLIGDSAYPLSSTMMTPFKDNGHLTREQRHYNRKISSPRQTVERTFGHIKGRFRQLRDLETLNIEHICHFVSAACVLHNICIISDDDISEYLDLAAEYNQAPNNYPAVFANADNGVIQRNDIVRYLQQFQ
jgi:predicted DNA-binding protein YlxM (UPF0122 family)